MRILVKLPSRSRPRAFRQVMQMMIDRATDLEGVHFLFTFDTDDPQYMRYIQASKGLSAAFTYDAGLSTSKIHAVNRGMDKVQEWDIVALLSDDMHCQHKGWDDRIRADMETLYPDLDGCLWYPDGHQENLCTLPIMGRLAYHRRGYIYDPSYKSLWCDNEWTEVWRRENKLVKLDTVLFRHKHPGWKTAKMDALYALNNRHDKADHENYELRKAAGFP